MSQMKSEEFEIPPIPPELIMPSDPVELERQLAEIEADMDAGNWHSHEEVGAWLLELAKGNYSPPPCDR
jgi:hypothetical protein